MAAGQLAREWMQPKTRLKRVQLKRLEDNAKAGSQVRVFFEKLSRLAEERFRSGNSEHGSLSGRVNCLQQLLGRGKPPHSPGLNLRQ
jgi:hypothetical protein